MQVDTRNLFKEKHNYFRHLVTINTINMLRAES